jgi:hypothetical protein
MSKIILKFKLVVGMLFMCVGVLCLANALSQESLSMFDSYIKTVAAMASVGSFAHGVGVCIEALRGY